MKLEKIQGITKFGYKFIITKFFENNEMVSASLNINDKSGKEFICLKPKENEIQMVFNELSKQGYISHAISFTAFA